MMFSSSEVNNYRYILYKYDLTLLVFSLSNLAAIDSCFALIGAHQRHSRLSVIIDSRFFLPLEQLRTALYHLAASRLRVCFWECFPSTSP